MRPPASPHSSKNQYPGLLVISGLFSGLLITGLVWLKLPNQFITFLSLFSLGLIGLGSFLYLRKPLAAQRRWVTVLAALAAVALVYLFPELFGPACGGMPRAFASPSLRCGRCVDFVCEWNYTKNKEHCYCNEWDSSGCPGSEPQPPAIEAELTCGAWGLNGWCKGYYSLDLSAVEPLGLDVMISGNIKGTPFSCSATPGTSTCSVPFPQGSGTAWFTATSSSGLDDSGSATFKRDSVPPNINGSLHGTAGQAGWFVSTVDVTASAWDPAPGSGMGTLDSNLNGAGWQPFTGSLSLSDGVHSLSLRAHDLAGKTAITDQTIQVDTITPALGLSLTGATGTNGWFRSNLQIAATASDGGSGLSAFEYELNGAGWTAYSAPLELGDGIHSVNMHVEDVAGNDTSWAQGFQVDTITPLLSLTVNGALGANGWYRSNLQLAAAASDGGSGVSAFEYDLNSTGWTAYSAPLELGDGIHSVNMRLIDVAGNDTTWAQSFQVDTLAPALSLNVAGAQGINDWYTSPLQVSLAASDPDSPLAPGSGLGTLEYNLDGAGWAAYSAPLGLSDGVHSLELHASDLAGNLTSETHGFQVDATPPALDVNVTGTPGAGSWYVSIVQVEGVASDAGSALAALEVQVDGGEWSAYNAALAFGDGAHSYRFRAMDNAGNLSETPPQELSVDTIPPAISLPALWELGESANFSLLDSGSGLASVRLVIEEEQGRYPEVAWEDALASDSFDGEIDWNGRFADDSLAPPGGKYFASLVVTDNAGNQSQATGQINVPLIVIAPTSTSPSTPTPTSSSNPKPTGTFNSTPTGLYNTTPTGSYDPTPTGSSNLTPTGTSSDPINTRTPTSKPSETITPRVQSTPSPVLLGGSNNDGASGEKTTLDLGGGHTDTAQTSDSQSFHTSDPDKSTQSPASSNLLWGATATAAVGAFTAEILRRKRQEEAKEHERIANLERAAARRESSDYSQKIRSKKEAELEVKWAAERELAEQRNLQRILTASESRLTRKEAAVEAEMSAYTKKPQELGPSYFRYMAEKALERFRNQERETPANTPPATSAKEEKKEQKSWWDKTVDWIDNNQVATSIGVGVAVGLGAAAIILTGGAALPVILGAVAVSGLITGGGTIALNARYQRDWNANLLRNSIVSIGSTIITAGITVIGAKIIGAGITACSMNPMCSHLIEPATKVIDFIEEASLVVKAGVQTFLGDKMGAGETLIELEMEHMDGGIPGNSLAKEIGEETVELLALHSDEAIKLIREYGDEAIEIITKYGDDGIKLLTTYGDDAVQLYKQYGKDVIPLLLTHGNDAVDIIGAYGDEGVALLNAYGNNAIGLVKEYGTPAVSLLGTLNPDSANKLLKNLDEDVIEYALTQGPDAVAALSHWPDDFLRKYGEELALRAKQDARALEAASRLVKLKNLNSKEAKELLDTIAHNSIQNTGDRLVLGKWVSGTLDEGFMGAARADGALFYGTNPGIEELFAKAKSTDPENIYWAVNNRVLEIATEQNLKIDYSLSGLPSESVPIEISAIKAIQSGMKSDEIAKKFFRGNFPFRMKEVEVLISKGYTFTVDATNNVIHWSKP